MHPGGSVLVLLLEEELDCHSDSINLESYPVDLDLASPWPGSICRKVVACHLNNLPISTCGLGVDPMCIVSISK